ncbi:MAG: hypothetical protein J5J00_07555 [Deltaproteobacteria bacterium]|nr:hypothetical protein [Deltaproteobacteria bacterium]
MNSKEKGSSSLSALMLLLTAIFAGAMATAAFERKILLEADILKSTRARNDKLNSLFERLDEISSLPGSKHSCIGESGALLCFLTGKREHTQGVPLIDLSRFAVPSASCLNAISASPTATTSGHSLTQGSAIAAMTCRITTGVLSGDIFMRENAESPLPSIAISPISGSPITIYTPGYLDIDGILELNGDALVIAGGDIVVESLSNPTAANKLASFYSLTGTILIRKISRNISLFAYAPQSVALPPGTINAANGLNAPELTWIPMAITETEDS